MPSVGGRKNFQSSTVICRKPHVASSICLRATIFQNPKGLCGHTVYTLAYFFSTHVSLSVSVLVFKSAQCIEMRREVELKSRWFPLGKICYQWPVFAVVEYITHT
jgi:hypothetical protein